MHTPPLRARARLSRRAAGVLATVGLLATSVAVFPSVAQAASPADATSNPASSSASVGVQQALQQAAASGQSVQATGATTPSSTLTASPDGSLTLSQSVAPVRKLVNGAWTGLNDTLVQNADGTVSPQVTTSSLVLSGGGSGPLATMSSGGQSLAVSFPDPLPAPTLSGSTATYTNVLPSTNLQITADDQGGFDEVLVVENAAAAANPAVQDLALTTTTRGLAVSTDAAGNLTARTKAGVAVFTAPAPRMWDSAKPTAAQAKVRTVRDPLMKTTVNAVSGLPVASSAKSPGEGAHIAPVAAREHGGKLYLVPDRALLTSPSMVFPAYIDPNFIAPSAATPLQAWTQTNSYYNTASYWKSSDLLRVGDQNWESPTFTARSFVQLSIPSKIVGANIISSKLNFTEEWSPSCTATGVQLLSTSAISSATTWNNPPTMGKQVGATQTVAEGYSSSCPAGPVGYDISSAMTLAASPTKPLSTLTFGLVASNESDPYGWKEFANTITYDTTYDHAPNTPTSASMSTSPTTACTGGPPVGDAPVTLYTKVSDPDGGTLGATYSVTNANTGAVIASSTPTNLYADSGQTIPLQISKTTLETAANGKATLFDWKVQIYDYHSYSNWSTVCSFTFDPTRPGQPTVTLPNGNTCGAAAASGAPVPTVGSVGSRMTLTVAPSTGTGTVTPSSYVYQLNGGAPQALGASSGNITITPTRFTNTLTVSSLSAGANYGDTTNCIFNSAEPATNAAPGDLTGGGVPDLLETGNQKTLPAGLWLASGQAGPGHTGDGHINADATDLGMYGSGIETTAPNGKGQPSDFNNTIVISGLFTRNPFQDVLAYYPATGTGEILQGNGDGSALDPTSAQNISSGSMADANGDNPIQLVNADNVTGDYTANTSVDPDLIGISGDATNGYSLNLYQGAATLGTYNGTVGNTTPLPNTAGNALPTPAGDADWNNWTITSTQIAQSGGTWTTAMYLWDKTTGALYLWTNLAYNTNATGTTDPFSYTQTQIAASGWNTGDNLTLQAADITGTGTPDLWTTGSTGTVTAYMLNTAGTGFTSTPGTDTLAPIAHQWDLDDQSSTTAVNPVTTGAAADATGGLPLSGSAGTVAGSTAPTWNNGDLFSPDVAMNTGTTATSSSLTTTGPAINLSSSFSVSLWAKPNAAGGAILSQIGTQSSGLLIYPDLDTGKWHFCLGTADNTSWDYDCAYGAPIIVGAWTHLTATYNSTDKKMALYVNGVDVATATHTPVATSLFRGALTVGAYRYQGASSDYFDGQVSQIQTWNQYLTPSQVAAATGNTGSLVFPSDASTYPSGSTWTQGATVTAFNQGQFTITTAGTPTYSVGTPTNPGAVLTLQSDGNLVAYPNAADAATQTAALWSTLTSGNSADTMLIQPDGNTVVYSADGAVLWASATYYPGADQWLLAGNTNDTAGTNPSTATSSVTWGPNHNGTANTAAVFNGTDGVIRTTAPAVNTTGSYTISAWLKVNALTGTQTALGQGTVNHQAFYLGYNATDGGWTYVTTTTDTTSSAFPTAEAPATAGVWTHLTATYAASTGTMTLYVNGVAKATATNTTPQYNQAGALTIGAISNVGTTGTYQPFAGSVSDVRTYPAALTATQVTALYTNS